VIVPEKVQQPMKGEYLELQGHSQAAGSGLSPSDPARDNDITQRGIFAVRETRFSGHPGDPKRVN
jgi:hypothetical protein